MQPKTSRPTYILLIRSKQPSWAYFINGIWYKIYIKCLAYCHWIPLSSILKCRIKESLQVCVSLSLQLSFYVRYCGHEYAEMQPFLSNQFNLGDSGSRPASIPTSLTFQMRAQRVKVLSAIVLHAAALFAKIQLGIPGILMDVASGLKWARSANSKEINFGIVFPRFDSSKWLKCEPSSLKSEWKSVNSQAEPSGYRTACNPPATFQIEYTDLNNICYVKLQDNATGFEHVVVLVFLLVLSYW